MKFVEWIARRRVHRRGGDDQTARVFKGFVGQLQECGYSIQALDRAYPAFDRRYAYLRYDILPTATDVEVGLRLAALHEQLGVPGAFHLAWDVVAEDPRLREVVLRLRDFDPEYVRLGLHCDPVSRWLAEARFGGDQREANRFVESWPFVAYLDDMLSAWRAAGDEAEPLCAVHDGAWACLVELDRSFRQALGRCSSISGRGSPLSSAFSKAREGYPELGKIAAWFSAIDFLTKAELERLGYPFEATRFAPDRGPGPTVLFGGVEPHRLQHWFQQRIVGGAGFVAIFPARYWEGDRYADLLLSSGAGPPANRMPQAHVALRSSAPAPPSEPAPDRPFLTNLADLTSFGPRCERVDTQQLTAAARHKIGSGVDRSFPCFIAWLRSEGYSFGGFEDGSPRFAERFAYLRHDVHIQDLLAAYVLAELHQRLAVIGSFQILWKFSRYEESVEPYFTKLLEFDRRFVQFGLHAAPTATWYLREKLNGDYTKQREAVESDDFIAWLLELHAAYCRDGDAARELRLIREGADDTLSQISVSFREAFGDWRTISGHGNFLTNGFVKAVERYPELRVLRHYFSPVAYLAKYGVARFGFDFELTTFGADKVPFPRLITESAPAETRRRWYYGRVERGAGFVALLHPATWTCSHNATFFLPAEGATAPEAPAPPEPTGSTVVEAAIARLSELLQEAMIAHGEDAQQESAAAQIAYNTIDCRSRAAGLARFVERAIGCAISGMDICELGAGFGGLCLHWAIEHGARHVVAVERSHARTRTLARVVREFGVAGLTVIEADLQTFAGHDGSVDLVVLNDVMYTADLSPERVAAACARLLRPEGRVVFRNVNRTYGGAVASHRDGTQFLDPDSANRAALFMDCGATSTLAHRPLSPWGLAAFLRQAGFGDFWLSGDFDCDGTQGSQGVQARYILLGRRGGRRPCPLRRLAPAPGDVLESAPLRHAVARETGTVRAAAEALCGLFGGRLSREAAHAEVSNYLVDRLRLDGLRVLPKARDPLARGLAKAIEHALDHALVAILSRHAGWAADDFTAADPGRLSSVLAECVAIVRRGCRQPSDQGWIAVVDWHRAAARVVEIVHPGAGRRGRAVAAGLLRHLVGDRFRLHAVGLFGRTTDFLIGSIEQEYGEACLDRIEAAVRRSVEPAAQGPRLVRWDEMARLLEEIEATIARDLAARETA